MYSPLQVFPNTCIYVNIKTLIFALAFLPFDPEILKTLNSLTLFSHQNEALQIMYTKCPAKRKKNNGKKVKGEARSKQKRKVKTAF